MSAMVKVGWQRMDVLVGEHGEGGMLHMLVDQVANGMSLPEICRNEGVPYSVLWKWLKCDEGRFQEYQEALKARAEVEAQRMLELVDGATAEDVALVKVQADVRKWLVGKWDRDRYGEKQSIEVTRVDVSMRELLAEREKRLLEIVPIEGKADVVEADEGVII